MGNVYETDKLLGEYLLFHYGKNSELMPWEDGPQDGLCFPVRTVNELLDQTSINPSGITKAFDIGCAVGRSAFELTQYCSQVEGCDLSDSFIQAASYLADKSNLSYSYLEEGNLFKSSIAEINYFHDRKPSFFVADACSLPARLGNFDVVHAANLICRLPDPSLFLKRLPDLVKIGGQLLLATPFTWLEEYTPMKKWIGSGDSEKKLSQCLSPYFELEKQVDLPFVIREHRRKFQYSVSLGTRWRRV